MRNDIFTIHVVIFLLISLYANDIYSQETLLERKNKGEDKCIRAIQDTTGRYNYRTYLIESDPKSLQSDTIFSIPVYTYFYDFNFDKNNLICLYYQSGLPFTIVNFSAFEKRENKWVLIKTNSVFKSLRPKSEPLEIEILNPKRIRVLEDGIRNIIEIDYEKNEVLRYTEH